MQKGQDTSAIKYISALSPTAISAAASSDPYDLGNYTFATLLVTTGSTGAATITADVQRSATSNGTFQPFGASINAGVLGGFHARSFVVASSAHFYKVYYTAVGGGSPVMGVVLAAAGVREAPIDQDSGTTSYSVISNG